MVLSVSIREHQDVLCDDSVDLGTIQLVKSAAKNCTTVVTANRCLLDTQVPRRPPYCSHTLRHSPYLTCDSPDPLHLSPCLIVESCRGFDSLYDYSVESLLKIRWKTVECSLIFVEGSAWTEALIMWMLLEVGLIIVQH